MALLDALGGRAEDRVRKARLHLLKGEPEKRGGEKKMTAKEKIERELEMQIMKACLRRLLDDLKAQYQRIVELQDEKRKETR